MTKKQKTMVVRLAVSAVFLIAGALMEGKTAYAWIPFVISYLSAGYDIPLKAVRNISHGQVFDENFLMTVATFGAIGCGALEEAVAVMLFYQVGELFSDYAVNKSRKSITELMDINPEYANLVRDGKEEKVDPYEVEIGDTIVVKPGEKVPLDGVIIKGSSSLDTKALTGESMPVEVKDHDPIISGSINLNGVLEVRVTKLFDDSTVAKILELVENASSRKAKAENFITKFARVYTPVVVCLALALAIIPPLLSAGNWGIWIYRACSFLVAVSYTHLDVYKRQVPGRADAVKRTAESDAAPDAGVTDKNIIMEDGIMKIAVTYENGGVFQHFGHSEQFKIYQAEEGTVVSSEVVGTDGNGHGALAGFLKGMGVETLICGGIGGGARNALSEAGIQLYPGVSGDADQAVEALLKGTLSYNPDTMCSHHHEGEEHDCSHGGGSCHH